MCKPAVVLLMLPQSQIPLSLNKHMHAKDDLHCCTAGVMGCGRCCWLIVDWRTWTCSTVVSQTPGEVPGVLQGLKVAKGLIRTIQRHE